MAGHQRSSVRNGATASARCQPFLIGKADRESRLPASAPKSVIQRGFVAARKETYVHPLTQRLATLRWSRSIRLWKPELPLDRF